MRLTHIALTCLCLVMSASLAVAKEKKQEKPTDMQAMMGVYTKLATPGEPHKLLASMAGSWNTKTKSWMEPNKPPTESIGSCEQKMLLGGRFLQQECTGDMMGQPFTGIGVNGYDNHTRKYVSTWMDSMGHRDLFYARHGQRRWQDDHPERQLQRSYRRAHEVARRDENRGQQYRDLRDVRHREARQRDEDDGDHLQPEAVIETGERFRDIPNSRGGQGDSGNFPA